jgi:hypothetical protein
MLHQQIMSLCLTIDITLNRMINGMHRLPCFVLSVLLVVVVKVHFVEQAQVVGTKQSRQANRAVGPAYYVLCLLLALALPRGFFTN